MFLKWPDLAVTRYALSLRQRDMHCLVGIITGHVALNRHLKLIGVKDNAICPQCSEEEETAALFGSVPGSCYYMATRIRDAPTYSSWIGQGKVFESNKIRTLLWEVYYTSGCFGDAHWAQPGPQRWTRKSPPRRKGEKRWNKIVTLDHIGDHTSHLSSESLVKICIEDSEYSFFKQKSNSVLTKASKQASKQADKLNTSHADVTFSELAQSRIRWIL